MTSSNERARSVAILLLAALIALVAGVAAVVLALVELHRVLG
ncbi:MAG TPA: hypothetical protein VEH79_05180 [Gaiellaceae bacterium]|nr:hypothetical protein [Gaiellaceae bacterium]